MIFLRVRLGVAEAVHTFDRGAIRIGRAETNDLVLDHSSVDPTHARLHRRGAHYFIDDCARSRPLLVNSIAVATSDVGPNDVIGLGAYELEALVDMPASTAREMSAEDAQADRDFLATLERQPSDDGARAEYADWLEERGRVEEAEYIRIQLAIDHATWLGLRFRHRSLKLNDTARRLQELAAALPLAWRATVARSLIESCSPGGGVTCPQRWDALTPTERSDERLCRACKKAVVYAPNLGAAQRNAAQGRAVVVDASASRFEGDLRPRPAIRVPRVPDRGPASPMPCLSIMMPSDRDPEHE